MSRYFGFQPADVLSFRRVLLRGAGLGGARDWAGRGTGRGAGPHPRVMCLHANGPLDGGMRGGGTAAAFIEAVAAIDEMTYT
jgi:hypothetical protein